MTLEELKEILTNNEKLLPEDLIIFKCSENHFLVNQYIEAICLKQQLQKNIIKSLAETESALSLVFSYETRLNVLYVDTFEEICADYSAHINTIIVCNKIDSKVEKKVSNFIINIPKLVDWQIIDYMKLYTKGLSDNSLNWLYNAANGDIYKILNTLDKVNLFEEAKRESVLAALKDEENTDLFNMQFFEAPEALYQNNIMKIYDYLKHKECCEIDAMSFVSQLLKLYKQNLFLIKSDKYTYKDLDLKSQGAVWAIKKNAPVVNDKTIEREIKFLSAIDLKLRSGELDIDKSLLANYIICKVIEYQRG